MSCFHSADLSSEEQTQGSPQKSTHSKAGGTLGRGMSSGDKRGGGCGEQGGRQVSAHTPTRAPTPGVTVRPTRWGHGLGGQSAPADRYVGQGCRRTNDGACATSVTAHLGQMDSQPRTE